MKRTGIALRRFLVWATRSIAKLWTAGIIIACLSSWLVVGVLTAANAVWGITSRTVETPSMAGTFDIGDVVWYLPADPRGNDLVVGRTLAIAPNGDLSRLYTHRVVSVEGDGTATLAGDAFVDDGVVDVFHPTQADVAGIPFAVTKNDTAKFVLNSVRNDNFRYVLTALGLGTFAMWLIVIWGLNRRDEGKDDAFADRFHEIELALIERDFISDPCARASETHTTEDPLAVFATPQDSAPDGQARSQSAKEATA